MCDLLNLIYIYIHKLSHTNKKTKQQIKKRGWVGGRIGKYDLYGFNYPNWFSEQCKYSDAEKKMTLWLFLFVIMLPDSSMKWVFVRLRKWVWYGLSEYMCLFLRFFCLHSSADTNKLFKLAQPSAHISH